MSTIIKTSEQEAIQRDQERFEQEQETNRMMAQEETKREEMKLAHEANENQLDRINKLQVAGIQGQGFDPEKDRDGDGEPDIMEYQAQALEESKAYSERLAGSKQRNFESSENEKDRNLKREEIASKEKMEKLKAKTALKNPVPGEKK